MIASLRAGHPVEVAEETTLADSLGGGIGLDNRYTFSLTQHLIDDVVQVSEDEIAAMASIVGAAYAGALGVTATSGPGSDVLPAETAVVCATGPLPIGQ